MTCRITAAREVSSVTVDGAGGLANAITSGLHLCGPQQTVALTSRAVRPTVDEVRALLMMVGLATGCVHADRVALATSTATLACDWGYTNREASSGWRMSHEANPVIGPKPEPGVVALYFSAVLVANVVAYYAMPAKYRSIAPIAITARQTFALHHNYGNDQSVCGF